MKQWFELNRCRPTSQEPIKVRAEEKVSGKTPENFSRERPLKTHAATRGTENPIHEVPLVNLNQGPWDLIVKTWTRTLIRNTRTKVRQYIEGSFRKTPENYVREDPGKPSVDRG